MTQRTPQRVEFLAHIIYIAAALDDYDLTQWADVVAYEDEAGPARARIVERRGRVTHHLDIDTIDTGIQTILKNKDQYSPRLYQLLGVCNALNTPTPPHYQDPEHSTELNAMHCDPVIQAGLFGKVRYA